MIVIWATGDNKIEIGRFQGEAVPEGPEADSMWEQITKLSDRPLAVKQQMDSYTPEVREEVLQGKISSKRWDDYRIRYKWKVVFNQNLEIYDYYATFFNSEKIGNPPTTDQASYNKNILESSPKAVPNKLGMFVKGQDGIKHWIRVESFDEQETIKAFMDLAKISSDQDIIFQINVDEAFTKMNVILKNDLKEIVLEKCKTKLFLIDKRAEEILKSY